MPLATVFASRGVGVSTSLSVVQGNVAVCLNSASVFLDFAASDRQAYGRLNDTVDSGRNQ